MRYLSYEHAGGGLPAHIDLSRSLPANHVFIRGNDERFSELQISTNVSSTHTFILYLTDCEEGGETVFLRSMKTSVLETSSSKDTKQERQSLHCSPNVLLGPPENIITSVRPKRGRLLLFPHNFIHAGCPVISVPKLLLRGEAIFYPDLAK